MNSTADFTLRDIRQRDLVPPEKLAACNCLVIGVGAIGRQVAIQLAVTGAPTLILVDHDVVAVENLAPQGYTPRDIGRPKVEATAEWCRQLNPNLIVEACAERFKRSSPKSLRSFGEIKNPLAVFCCVDSIATRKIVWEAVKSPAAFFADARMAAEVVRVLASDRPATDSYYSTTLFDSGQAYAGACTAKSTIYTASIAAGLMVSQFTRWLRGLPVERDLLLNLLAAELTVT
jgi:sulfur carrier protein ThiS adenylyltransferase